MCTRCAFLAGVTAFAAAPAFASARTGDPASLEIAMPGMRRLTDTVWLGRMTPNVWVFTTTKVLDSGYYPANGAIVVDGKESLIIDAGWLAEQASVVLDEWQRTKQPPISRAISTHFHGDRTLGIPVLKARGIPAYGNPLTIGLALDNQLPAPMPLHDVEKHPVKMGDVEVFYPGPGHTLDNIVVWIPSDRVLFGGCLVKSTTTGDLGYLEDSDVPAWPATMRKLAAKYPNAKHVIPGHGTVKGDSIAHTLALAIAGK